MPAVPLNSFHTVILILIPLTRVINLNDFVQNMFYFIERFIDRQKYIIC